MSGLAEGLRLRLEKLSQVRGVAEGLRGALCQTGEPYREFRSLAEFEKDALERLYDDVAVYAGGRAGVLYWRVRPEALEGAGLWSAYARLLISGSPVQPAAGLYADEPSLKSAVEAVCIAVRCVRDGDGLRVRLPMPEVDRSTLQSHGVAADMWPLVTLPDFKKIEAAVLEAMRELTGHGINPPIPTEVRVKPRPSADSEVVTRLEPVEAASRPPQFPYRETILERFPESEPQRTGGYAPAPTWVLIVTSDVNARPPAVIGGYQSKAEAVAAGEAALGDPVRRSVETWAKEHWGWKGVGHGDYVIGAPYYPGPEAEWRAYTVVPGAATSGPENYRAASPPWDGVNEGSDGTHSRFAG